MTANERQVDGSHYKSSIQHWDYVIANELDYFQAQVTKYITRWKKKNGLKDLEKALHFLEKYIEIEKEKIALSDAAKIKSSKIAMDCPFGYDPKEHELVAEDIKSITPTYDYPLIFGNKSNYEY